MTKFQRKLVGLTIAIATALGWSGCLTPRPRVVPVAGVYPCPETVTISDQRSDAAIFYTLDGTTPTTSSTRYSGPFTISSADTVKAIALAPGAKASNPASVNYTCAITDVSHADFAVALQRRFNLPQPSHPVKFSDIHPGDVNYSAAEAIYPLLRRQLLCPGCLLSSNFAADSPLRRAQASIVFVGILLDAHKVKLVSQDEASALLANVSDAKSLPLLARPFVATALKVGIITLQPGNKLEPMQPYSRSDMNAAFKVMQRQFDLPPIAAGTQVSSRY